MNTIFGNNRRSVLFISDFILWNISFYISFAVNKNTFSLRGQENAFFLGLLAVNICFSAVFLIFRLYDKLWSYADIEDFFYALIAALTANLAFMSCTMTAGIWYSDLNFGSRIYITFAMMSALLIIMFRIIYRLNKILERRNLAGKASKRLLIVGAGETAFSVLTELSKAAWNEYIPICLVDDDKEKLHRRIAGIKVAGTTEDIPQLCYENDIQAILFTISHLCRYAL